jgi:hypothetical protein
MTALLKDRMPPDTDSKYLWDPGMICPCEQSKLGGRGSVCEELQENSISGLAYVHGHRFEGPVFLVLP